MSKAKPPQKRKNDPKHPSPTQPKPDESPEGFFSSKAVRETIESIVIAFVLAFLFRTFEAEAFVIPTGSMAPTLMGRHKDLACERCGYWYRAGASVEEDDGRLIANKSVVRTTCPMCRYVMELGVEENEEESIPFNVGHKSFSGDRILVSKFAYDFADPERWEVVVFKFPGNAKQNYIKRLVGLSNETVMISHGDVYFGPHPLPEGWSKADFKIARKPPHKVWATMQDVYDNDYRLAELIDAGIPDRWRPWVEPSSPVSGGWVGGPDQNSFQTDGSAAGEVWIRYRHVPPSDENWEAILDGDEVIDPPQPSLITDDYAYNNFETKYPIGMSDRGTRNNANWVGDLMVQAELEVSDVSGEILLELAEGGVFFTCRIDVATGKATLSISDDPEFSSTGQTEVRGPGTYRLAFANADDRLYLWADKKPWKPLTWLDAQPEVVRFDSPTTFGPLGNVTANEGRSRMSDLAPVRIGSRGVALTARHLRVKRDVYYRRVEFRSVDDTIQRPEQRNGRVYFEMDSDQYFLMGPDQFFVLGDNSPASSDGRHWPGNGLGKNFGHFVERRLLTGKAFFIYYPHPWPSRFNPLPWDVKPNIQRMGLVR